MGSYVGGQKVGRTKTVTIPPIEIPREVDGNGVYSSNGVTSFKLPSDATDIGIDGLYSSFRGCTSLVSVDLSSLTSISGGNGVDTAFRDCTGLTTVDLSSLTTITGVRGLGSTFYNCTSLSSLDLSSLQTVSGTQAMSYAFYNCTSLTSVDLSSLTTVSGQQAMDSTFSNCSLESVDLSSLTTVSGSNAMYSAFSGTSLESSLDLSSLTTVSGSEAMSSTFSFNMFQSVDLSSLTTIGTNSSSTDSKHFANCFYECYSLTSLSFPSLEKIYCTGSASASAPNGTFSGNTRIQKMYFPKLDTITYGTGASSSNQNACKYIFANCSSLTELHFGATNQAAIEASLGYSTAWGRGAGNVTIYFDL